MTTEAELVALQQLYELKKIRAKQRINEQRQAVDVALREAEQQRVAVQNLQTELQANRQYRSEHGVSSDAQKIVDALSHRERIENSLERQSYYLLVAEEDLGDQRRELDLRHRAFEKIRLKQESVAKQWRKRRVHQDEVRQNQLEEEIPMRKPAGAII
jgi:hypothetical protein